AEAKQTAKLFGEDVQLYEADAGANPVATATRLLAQRQVQVLLGASTTDADALSRFAEQRQVVFFNVASRAQELRAACRRYTFHVEASQGMYTNAALLAARQAVAGQGPPRAV